MVVGAAVVAAAPLVLVAGTAIAGAVAGGGTAAVVAETGAAAAGAACTDGDCGNELSAVTSVAAEGAEILAPALEVAEEELAGAASYLERSKNHEQPLYSASSRCDGSQERD
jgi:hypothetical protein